MHVQFWLFLHDLHTGFSRGRSGGLVFPSLSEFSTVYCDPHKDFGIVNKAEGDFFLALSCFFNDPVDVGNLISGSSAFSKTSLNIWKFMVHILLKPGLENFEHYFTNMWDECNCALVWAFFGINFVWDWNESWSNLRTYKDEDKAWLEIIVPHPKYTHTLFRPQPER